MRSRITICSLAGALALALAPSVASAGSFAATLTLTPDNSTAIQQTTQDPCIFGNPPCGQNNDSIGDGSGNPFPWERTPLSSEEGNTGPLVVGNLTDSEAWGNGSGETNDYDGTRILTSRLRTVLATDNFEVGVDVNQTGDDAYTLESFVLQIFTAAGALVDTWTFTNVAGSGVIPPANNGTGWSDAIIRFPGLDLDNYAAGSYAIFTTDWSGNTDGADNYFLNSLTPGEPVIPEPASLLLLGSGLVGAAGALRRRRSALRNKA